MLLGGLVGVSLFGWAVKQAVNVIQVTTRSLIFSRMAITNILELEFMSCIGCYKNDGNKCMQHIRIMDPIFGNKKSEMLCYSPVDSSFAEFFG